MDYKIDKTSPIPYYYQIYQSLKKYIENNKLEIGEFLPSERELVEKFNVSRITIRKSLDFLMSEGLIKKVKGKGSIIAAPKIEEQILSRLVGTYEDLSEKGFKITNKIISFKLSESNEKFLESLNLLTSDRVYIFERVRFINSEPYQYSKAYLPEKFCPNFDRFYKNLIHKSFYKILEEKYGLKIFKIIRKLEACLASPHDNKYLEVKIGSPILAFENIAYLKDGTPIEIGFNRIKGNMAKFEAVIEISTTTSQH